MTLSLMDTLSTTADQQLKKCCLPTDSMKFPLFCKSRTEKEKSPKCQASCPYHKIVHKPIQGQLQQFAHLVAHIYFGVPRSLFTRPAASACRNAKKKEQPPARPHFCAFSLLCASEKATCVHRWKGLLSPQRKWPNMRMRMRGPLEIA